MFDLGEFVLSSGRRSFFKIDCDALTNADLDALAQMALKVVKPFSRVESIPRGGDRLAAILRHYIAPYLYAHILVVDDVLTTGHSFETKRNSLLDFRHVEGLTIFQRGEGLPWVKSLFKLPPELWTS